MNRRLASLAGLLATGREARHPVAFDANGIRSWGEFAGQVAALSARLEAAEAARWLVFSEDSYVFAVSLLAVAHSGGIAVLPPNAQAGTLSRLREFADGVLVDAAVPLDVVAGPVVRQHPDAVDATAAKLERLDPEAPFVEFFTSGTSGSNKRVPKCLRHLDEEVAVLEGVFGDSLGDARVVSMVSHQHIYGTLFRILWPLAAGRPFSSRTYLHGSEVVGRLAEERSVLISSPVQLKAMTDSEALVGAAVADIFSSGAPLDERTATVLAGATGTAVAEIIGSTETGGVGWRRRPRGGEAAWIPFPGVAVERSDEGRLAVTSRLVSVGTDLGEGCRRFVMGDRVEIDAAGSFLLRGRVDRVVKIGSKRLSLPEMEAELDRHPWVEETALAVARRGLDSRVCAAVVLSATGRDRLAETGRGETGKALATALSPYFDRVLLPRMWRFVERLPRTPQGKLPEAGVRALFDPEGRGPLGPVIESEHVEGNSLRRSCTVPEDLAFLAGHFDGFPVVPGVALLQWVVAASHALIGRSPEIAAIEALKFRQPLLPGSRFELEVVADDDGKRLRFRLWREDGEVSTGRILFS